MITNFYRTYLKIGQIEWAKDVHGNEIVLFKGKYYGIYKGTR